METTKTYQDRYLEVIAYFHTQEATAEALDVAQSTVNGWAKGRHFMSARTAMRVQRKTKGKFKALDLYPDESMVLVNRSKVKTLTGISL